MTSLGGTITIGANATITRITGSPFPVVGTVTLDCTSSSFSGEVLLKKRRTNPSSGTGWKSCTYQTSDSLTDAAAGAVIIGDKTVYLRCDGEEVGYVSQNYVSGTLLMEWTWSAG